MSQRESNLLWLKDLLEQLSARRQQLEWAEDPDSVRILCETMLGDLDRCKRICEIILRRGTMRTTV